MDMHSDEAVTRSVKIIEAGKVASGQLDVIRFQGSSATATRREIAKMKRAKRAGSNELADFIDRNRGLITRSISKHRPAVVGTNKYLDVVRDLELVMIEQLPKWDLTRGRFSTFINPWLQQACTRSESAQGPVRVPSETGRSMRSKLSGASAHTGEIEEGDLDLTEKERMARNTLTTLSMDKPTRVNDDGSTGSTLGDMQASAATHEEAWSDMFGHIPLESVRAESPAAAILMVMCKTVIPTPDLWRNEVPAEHGSYNMARKDLVRIVGRYSDTQQHLNTQSKQLGSYLRTLAEQPQMVAA